MPIVMLNILVDAIGEHGLRKIGLGCDRRDPDDLFGPTSDWWRRLHLGLVQRGLGILEL
jgi:hypothetical protein